MPGPVRKTVGEVQARNQALQDQKNKELADRVANATLDHLKAKLEADLEILKERVPSAAKEALETAKDQKYLRDRQLILASMWFKNRLDVFAQPFATR